MLAKRAFQVSLMQQKLCALNKFYWALHIEFPASLQMLPGHAYPKLKAYKSLAGHFGGAWNRQSHEFAHFPGKHASVFWYFDSSFDRRGLVSSVHCVQGPS